MKTKQSILEDYSEIKQVSINDITTSQQKYIHFWDFIELDNKVHEFQARMEIAISNLRKDMKERYKEYYTNVLIQSPEQFTRHNRELGEIEFMLENPFYLAILDSALKKEVDEKELRHLAINWKKRLMEKRFDIKESLEQELKRTSEILVR
jgi:hypothetical protein